MANQATSVPSVPKPYPLPSVISATKPATRRTSVLKAKSPDSCVIAVVNPVTNKPSVPSLPLVARVANLYTCRGKPVPLLVHHRPTNHPRNFNDGHQSKCDIVYVSLSRDLYYLTIPTLEGQMTGSPGDYIIKGTIGEFYPCKPKAFTAKYDSVPDDLTGLPSPTPTPSEK